jgi:hypothetical protein
MLFSGLLHHVVWWLETNLHHENFKSQTSKVITENAFGKCVYSEIITVMIPYIHAKNIPVAFKINTSYHFLVPQCLCLLFQWHNSSCLFQAQHPNIVTVREIVVGSNMDKIFIVMDYVEHDLKSLMETMKQKKQVFIPGNNFKFIIGLMQRK